MAVVKVSGQPCSLPEATAEAARLLVSSRFPVVAGLAADVAGVRAAILLAAGVGGAIDHLASDASLRNLSVMRDAGWMIVSPGEVRRRSDVILLVGPGLGAAWPDLADRILTARGEFVKTRQVICLGCGSYGRTLSRAGLKPETLNIAPQDLAGVLAALRARLAGRPVTLDGPRARIVDRIATTLRAAKFGTAIWSAESLDVLAVEMLAGLVKDLNAQTRFSGLPLPGPDNVAGADQVSGWMTGFPTRTGLARGYPEHDPWRFDAVRLIESGEADAALWISAYRPVAPPWRRSAPLVALTAPGTRFAEPPSVHIEVATPGIDHDGVAYLADTASLGHVKARVRSNRPSVAAVLDDIRAALPEREGRP